MATAATSLADFHQMIKLFGADTDEMTGGTTTGTIPTAATFVSTDELEDEMKKMMIMKLNYNLMKNQQIQVVVKKQYHIHP